MTRTELHATALAWAAGMAKRRGRCLDGAEVRVATQQSRLHRVYVRGKRYVYRYDKLQFNIQKHGVIPPRLPRLWVFIDWTSQVAWLVPSRVLGRVKTVTLHKRKPGTPCKNRVEPYASRWDLLKAKHA